MAPACVRTWAKKGQASTLEIHGTKRSLSLLCALVVSPGRDRFGLLHRLKRRGSYRWFDVFNFLLMLRTRLKRKLYVVLDNLSAHKKAMRILSWVLPMAGLKGQIEAVWLPAYSPDLNPVEQVFGQLKNGEFRNRCFDDVERLESALHKGLAKIREKPALIRAFFKHAGLAL